MNGAMRLLLVLLVCGWGIPNTGETNDRVQIWTAFRQHDGLAHNVVNAVVQTPDGAMWFGTFEGISRYDGHTWQTFGRNDGLSGHEILDLEVAPNGVLWAGVGGGFTETKQAIARFSNGQWQGIETPGELLGRFGARQILGHANQHASVITDDGKLLLYDGKQLKPVDISLGELLRGVQGMIPAENGQLWVFYGSSRRSIMRFGSEPGLPSQIGKSGVGLVDLQTGQYHPFKEEGGLEGELVLAMAQTPDGALWFGTANGGVRRFYRGQWHIFTTVDGLPSDRVQVIQPSSDGLLWMGTPAGVVVYRPDGQWVAYSERDGLPNNFIESICVAQDGSVWVGTRGGVARFGSTGWLHHTHWPGRKDRGGVALSRSPDGKLWAGTAEGLYRLENKVWVNHHRFDIQRGRIVGMKVDGQGRFWCMLSGQLWYLDQGQWHMVLLPPEIVLPLRAFATAKTGGVWVVARSGVFRFDGQTWISNALEGFVVSVFESSDGVLWVGRNDGVTRFVGGQPQVFGPVDGLPDGQIAEIGEDKHGRIWVSSFFEGVAFYDASTKQWTRVPGDTDAQMNGVRRIYPAQDGTVWLASFIDGAGHTNGAAWVRYTVREGLPSSQVWDVCQDGIGQLWFATSEGLASCVLDRDSPETQLVSPPGQIAPYQSVLMEFTGQDAWKLSPDWTLQYAWRLNGGTWSAFSRSTRVLLEPKAGLHTFEVRAMDLSFNVDESPAIHVFEVLAPVWQRPWFIGLCLGALLCLGISSGYALQRHYRWRETQARLIEELESELQEAHDMQMQLLPKEAILQGEFEVAGRCWPANHVGGDYFTYFWMDGKRQTLGFGAADVSGKAMQAAVRAMQLSEIFRYEFRTVRPPGEVLKNLHAVLLEHFDTTSFVTCCLGLLDFSNGHVHIGNAGHPYPYHYSATTKNLHVLEISCVPLGMVVPPGATVDPGEVILMLEPGDALVLYSDGVTDMQNAAGDFYDEARLEGLIKIHAVSGAKSLIDAVFQDLAQFKGSAPQTDDVTLLVLVRQA